MRYEIEKTERAMVRLLVLLDILMTNLEAVVKFKVHVAGISSESLKALKELVHKIETEVVAFNTHSMTPDVINWLLAESYNLQYKQDQLKSIKYQIKYYRNQLKTISELSNISCRRYLTVEDLLNRE